MNINKVNTNLINTDNITANTIFTSTNLKLIMFVLFIILVLLIVNLNFTECFGPLITDPEEITTYCNSQEPSADYNAPSFVNLFTCGAQNIVTPQPYQIVLSPINVCPINAYLYSSSSTNQCIMTPYTPNNNNLIAWFDPSNSKYSVVSNNTIELSNISNNTNASSLKLTTTSGTIRTSNLIKINEIPLLNNLSQYSLIRINNKNTTADKNSYLSVNTENLITNSFTIFIVYNVILHTEPNYRVSLFNTSTAIGNNIIGMIGGLARFIGNNNENRLDATDTILKIGDRDETIGDINNLSLYTASVQNNGTKIIWTENVYNKFLNSTKTYERRITLGTLGTLCNVLNICGSSTSLKSNGITALATGFNGYLGEILLYNTALSPTELPTSQTYDSIVTYLRNKWNI